MKESYKEKLFGEIMVLIGIILSVAECILIYIMSRSYIGFLMFFLPQTLLVLSFSDKEVKKVHILSIAVVILTFVGVSLHFFIYSITYHDMGYYNYDNNFYYYDYNNWYIYDRSQNKWFPANDPIKINYSKYYLDWDYDDTGLLKEEVYPIDIDLYSIKEGDFYE